jgi:hypothetical protein
MMYHCKFNQKMWVQSKKKVDNSIAPITIMVFKVVRHPKEVDKAPGALYRLSVS